MRYYILVKRKNAKKWLGAIPTRKGTSKEALKKRVLRNLKSNVSAKIITQRQLQSLLKKAKSKIPSQRKPTISRKKRVIRRRKRR